MAPGAPGHKGRFQPCHLFRAVICLLAGWLAGCLSAGRGRFQVGFPSSESKSSILCPSFSLTSVPSRKIPD